MEIRKLRDDDLEDWLALRELLWPDFERDELAREQAEILADSQRNCVWVAASLTGELLGFVEVSLRDWAEGCSSMPVGYIEAWYVKPAYRRTGIGHRLIEAAEHWAFSRGCSEMGSDAELWNDISHKAHAAVGYTEVLRLVLFSKRLDGAVLRSDLANEPP